MVAPELNDPSKGKTDKRRREECKNGYLIPCSGGVVRPKYSQLRNLPRSRLPTAQRGTTFSLLVLGGIWILRVSVKQQSRETFWMVPAYLSLDPQGRHRNKASKASRSERDDSE